MKRASRHRPSSSGFTLVESVVGLTLFSVVGYALLIAADVSYDSRRAVMGLAEEDRALRQTTSVLVDELAASSDSTITVTALADGNHRVRFMLPIEAGGALAWGVKEHGVPQTGWSVQYTVLSTPLGNGQTERVLARQVVDDQDVVRDSDTLIEGLRRGTDDPPGFRMVQSGEMWELTLSTAGRSEDTTGIEETFHVRTRN